MKKENLMPLNLQFFAENPDETPKEEPKENPTEEPKDNPKDEPKEDDKPSEDSKRTEPSIQNLMVENAKQKRAIDKLTKELGDLNKKYRATLSEQEIASMEKAEAQAKHDEEFESMKRQLKVNEFTENFMALGYSRDLAKQAAAAQVDGDTDTLFKIQKDVQEQVIKAREQEWLANRPELQSGGTPKEEEDPFVKGFNSVKQYH